MSENKQIIPTQIEVVKYFLRLGLDQKHADAFFYYYTMLKWEYRPGRFVKNWKGLAYQWIQSFTKASPIQRRILHKKR